MAKKEKNPVAPGTPAGWNKIQLWLFRFTLLAVTALAYLPAWNGKLIWDDDAHLTRPQLRSWHGLSEIWTRPGATQQYYPLVHTVFWVEQKLWGDAVLPYHLVNIALHVFSAWLLLSILTQLRIRGAWLAASIFALHPVQVESVAWISELKNTLSGVFYLSAAYFYLRFDHTRERRPYVLSFLFFSLGLMSKTVIATLPPALLVIFWWQRGKLSWKRDIRPLLPFFVVGIAAGLFTAWIERTQIGAEGADFDYSFIERGLIAGRAFWFYLAKLLWPYPLIFVYPRWQVSATAWWQYLYPVSAIGFLLLLIWRKAKGMVAALLFFGGSLFPVLGFANVYPFLYSFVADHFQYLASIGIITLAATGVISVLDRLRLNGKIATGLLWAAIPMVLGLATWNQSRSYADPEILYRHTLEKNPGAWMAHNNLANYLVRHSRVVEAIPHYRQALALRPRYVEAHYNLGNALLQRGEIEASVAECEAALAIDPRSVEAHNNLGNAFRQQGKFREAIAHYEQVLSNAPGTLSTQTNLAWLLATCPDQSLRDIPRALQLATEANEQSGQSNPVILHTLSAAYVQSGDLRRGREAAGRALRIAEEQGQSDLAQILGKEIAQLDRFLSDGG